MKLPEISVFNKPTGLSTAGLTGIVLMTLHITEYLTHWAWAILYVFLILVGIGQENKNIKKMLNKMLIDFEGRAFSAGMAVGILLGICFSLLVWAMINGN